MARPNISSTCVLAEQIIHCRKNHMRTQHIQKNPTLPTTIRPRTAVIHNRSKASFWTSPKLSKVLGALCYRGIFRIYTLLFLSFKHLLQLQLLPLLDLLLNSFHLRIRHYGLQAYICLKRLRWLILLLFFVLYSLLISWAILLYCM